MPDKRHWSSALAAGLANLATRLDERHARVTARDAADRRSALDPLDAPPAVDGVDDERTAAAGTVSTTEAAAEPVSAPPAVAARTAAATVPAPRAVPVTDPVTVVPWSMRVAAEIGWRLLILAGTVWVLMRVIGAIQLVVLSFAAALLITALLQPFVARLKRAGVPRGLATAIVCVSGFVIIGLVGWFVVWQVMDNIDNLSSSLQDGIAEGKKWLLNSPFHVTDDQINQVADNLSNALSHNTKQLTDAGLQGVTFLVEFLTGMLLTMFSTLFLLYDGPNIWNWVLKLFPEPAREGLAGAGPRAWRTLTHYVRGTVLVALIDAICIGVGIFFLGVPMAVPLAVVIFLCSFVPLVGAVTSGAMAVVVALVTEGPITALVVLGVVLAVQQIEGHILQPFILGRAVRVHPLAVVLSVAAGSLVAGIGGAVVAVPLVAVGNTVVGYLRAYSRQLAAARAAEQIYGTAAVAVAPAPVPATVAAAVPAAEGAAAVRNTGPAAEAGSEEAAEDREPGEARDRSAAAEPEAATGPTGQLLP
ncbi:AI-2E family transporter [Streptomyces sp. HPF1205]|uniref:AI-2E family transporter n=1 Tax=Streptomyces sp. HPF1205 TaxID=2873262 RepID=UPI001CEDF74B|nr:AI-2E family transporter [Streptomyces sp. HPF1205]